jgi:hypothetical protein
MYSISAVSALYWKQTRFTGGGAACEDDFEPRQGLVDQGSFLMISTADNDSPSAS